MSRFDKQWQSIVLWIVAILGIVVVTLFYQPTAAKTGSLLIWMNNKLYRMDIDTLTIEPIAPASRNEAISVAPGCLHQTETPCWVTVENRLYRVTPHQNSSMVSLTMPNEQWPDSAVSWSPDGHHVAYTVVNRVRNQLELRLYDATNQTATIVAHDVDPLIPVAWNSRCGDGLTDDCLLAYKTVFTQSAFTQSAFTQSATLVSLNLMTKNTQEWAMPPESLTELRWSPDDTLLYSGNGRSFHRIDNHAPAYNLSTGATIANIAPDASQIVYYEPFTIRGCDSTNNVDCLYVGVWLKQWASEPDKRDLVYSVHLATTDGDGLTFIPTWNQSNNGFVFFQEGNLVYYDAINQEAVIWDKSLRGKIRSMPVFSPNKEAVAFVDNQGQGVSEYRLKVINPRLQPVDHVIETETGFRVLAWLPD
ncbi:hypothetical protein QUF58_13900 [Anaerolineales bacterium HSG24]|nr:hypothetical protein [Anaerolineales bacterium HSG24]